MIGRGSRDELRTAVAILKAVDRDDPAAVMLLAAVHNSDPALVIAFARLVIDALNHPATTDLASYVDRAFERLDA